MANRADERSLLFEAECKMIIHDSNSRQRLLDVKSINEREAVSQVPVGLGGEGRPEAATRLCA